MNKRIVRIKFWDGGAIGGWTCAVDIDGRTYPVNRVVGDGSGASVSVSFDSRAQARKAAISEARQIIRECATQPIQP